MPMNQEDHDLLIKVSTMVENIQNRLFGDENTGELPVMRKRIAYIEGWKNKVVGAIAIIAFVLTVFGGMLISHLQTHVEVLTK